MPWNFFRPTRAGGSPARRRGRDLESVATWAVAFLFVYIGLIWVLPILWTAPNTRVVEVTDHDPAHTSSPPARQPRSDLMLLVDDDDQDRSGETSKISWHDFNLVDALGRIVDHPRQFLKARYVTRTRVLSENVTSPVFADTHPTLRNNSIDLIGWLRTDTQEICMTMITGTRNAIVTLAQQKKRCGPGDAAKSERSARDAAAVGVGPQDVHCSADNAHKRAALLRSARDFEPKIKDACNQIKFALIKVKARDLFSNRDSLVWFLKEIKENISKMEKELEFLSNVISFMQQADFALSVAPERLAQQLRGRVNTDGARFDVLASRSATGYPGDIDPLTAVLLHVLQGTLFVTSPTLLYDIKRADYSSSNTTSQWPTRWIREELEHQASVVNNASELLASTILPGAQEWSALMREVNDTGAFRTPNDLGYYSDYGDVEMDRKYYIDRWRTWYSPRRRWADPNKADRMVKAVDDGADHLAFLRGYLVDLQHGLPGMMTRLDRWDAEVAQLSDDLTLVLSSGKKYTGRRQKAGKQRELEITRWQIHPWSLTKLWLGLDTLKREINESWALSESFNPQDSWQDNWFESQMHRWSRERAALRAQWEVEQGHKARARMTFWQHVGNMMEGAAERILG